MQTCKGMKREGLGLGGAMCVDILTLEMEALKQTDHEALFIYREQIKLMMKMMELLMTAR